MRKIKMTVEYDGTDFAGFQTQATGIRTVQETITCAIEKLTGEEVVVHGAGRTDSGVHALGQVIHFQTGCDWAADKLFGALNGVLPRDVSVRELSDVGPEFHARYSAVRRTYLYGILNRPARSSIWHRFSLHEPRALNVLHMRAAANLLTGTRDFASFANTGGEPGSTTVRRVERLQVRRIRRGDIVIVVATANGFLRSMVRNLVGVLVDVGRGKLTLGEVSEILAAKDRTANPSATIAAHGLCLYRVDYDFEGLGRTASAAIDPANDEEG